LYANWRSQILRISTLTEWNLEQADAYANSIFARLDWLTENPSAGKQRNDLKLGYYCFPEGRHLIFYTLTDGMVDVIGIPLQNMDVIQNLMN
jgi:toxin ParE1/3/4